MSESKTIQVTATPEVLAEMAVRPARREDGALDGVTLHWPSGTYAGMVGRLPVEDPGASNPLAYVRAWLVGHITAAYEAGKAKAEGGKASDIDLGWHFAMGHVAQILGIDDSGDPKAIEERIRAEVSRLKDRADAYAVGADVAGLRARIVDLTAEVERLKAENERLQQREPTLAEMQADLGDKPEGSCLGWPTVRRCYKCNDPTPGGPTLCHPCGLKMNESELLERGRRQGWEAAIEAMDKAAEEDRAAMFAAGDALKAAQEQDTLAKNRVVGTSYAATALRRASQKANGS